MQNLKDLLQELGISKVRLAKYLGVSRQMIYNYLELNDLNKWPKGKKILLFKLFDIKDADDIKNIEVNTDYLMNVENRLNQGVQSSCKNETYFELQNMDADSKNLLNDIINLLREKLSDDNNREENYYAFKYLFQMLESIDNVPEVRYIFGYMSKVTGFTDPNEFKFNEEKQFIFESILYTALSLYNNGGANRSKLVDSHRRFVKEIEQKKEEKLGRTQQLNINRDQALKELGYTEVTRENASEVIEKMAEIESRGSIIKNKD